MHKQNQGRHLKTQQTFSMFILLSMLMVSIVVLSSMGLSIKTSLESQEKRNQILSVEDLIRDMNQYIKVHLNDLMGQSQLPLLTQAALQPDVLLPDAVDLFRELPIQQQYHQQLLLDFSGEILYQRFSQEIPPQVQRPWFLPLSSGQREYSTLLVTETTTYVELVVPLIYNQSPEGYLSVHISWAHILENLRLQKRLELYSLRLRKKGETLVIINPQESDSGEWRIANSKFLGFSVEYQLNQHRINAIVNDYLALMVVELIAISILLSFIGIRLGRRFFVDPVESLGKQLQALEDGHQKKLTAPENISRELADVIQKFNQMSEKISDNEQSLLQANQQLRDNQAQLIQSEKMASLGLMAAGVAHEINNPVAFVRSNTNSLNEYIDDFSPLLKAVKNKDATQVYQECINNDIVDVFADIKSIVTESEEGLQRVSDIVTGLKQFTHSDIDTTEEVNVRECVEFTLKLIWNELKYNARVEVTGSCDASVKANNGALSQVLTNLLINASHAIEKNGHIRIGIEEKADVIAIRITDNGSGMERDTLNRIFEPFYTEKPVGVGTGLGLSISYGIIEKYNGTIAVESEPGIGSTFTITLPSVNSAQ